MMMMTKKKNKVTSESWILPEENFSGIVSSKKQFYFSLERLRMTTM